MSDDLGDYVECTCHYAVPFQPHEPYCRVPSGIPACAHGLCDADAVEVVNGEPLCGHHVEVRHGP